MKPTLLRVALTSLSIALLVSATAPAVELSSQESRLYTLFKSASGQNRPKEQIRIDPILVSVARARAKDMADRGYFDHVNPDGHGPNYLASRAGYRLPEWWGSDARANYIESIGGGYSDADGVWGGWMDSSGHTRHLLAETDFYRSETAVGVGHYYKAGSRYGHYWVVLTAPPSGPAVRIVTPRRLARINVPEVSVTGIASSDPVAVEYSVINASGTTEFQPALGTSDWTANVAGLTPGRNHIIVRSLNGNGELMAKSAVVVKHIHYSTLTVAISGEGSVTPGFLGTTTRRVGKKLKIAAAPAAGWQFAGWTGSVEATTRRLKTRMVDDMQLTAVFEPIPTAPLQ